MTDLTNGINKLKLLKLHKGSQIGGKGSVRRKKQIRTKKITNNKFVADIEKNTKIIQGLLGEKDLDIELFNKYSSIFKRDFVNKIKREDKRKTKNPTNLKFIKQTILKNLLDNKFDLDFVNLCKQNLIDGALNTLNRFLQQIIDILNVREYYGFEEFNKKSKEKDISKDEENKDKDRDTNEDNQIRLAFEYFDLDITQQLYPSILRRIYKDRLTNNETTSELERHYFVLLNMIQKFYLVNSL